MSLPLDFPFCSSLAAVVAPPPLPPPPRSPDTTEEKKSSCFSAPWHHLRQLALCWWAIATNSPAVQVPVSRARTLDRLVGRSRLAQQLPDAGRCVPLRQQSPQHRQQPVQLGAALPSPPLQRRELR
jgi:hypothetical protein